MLMGDLMEASDFWWLDDDIEETSLFIKAGHHRPLTDGDDPLSVPWQRSLDKAGNFSNSERLYPLDFLNKWRGACGNTNVYRSLMLFDAKGKPARLGPFLIDIDNSQMVDGYNEDLEDTILVARALVKVLIRISSVAEKDIRNFFSGRKGFNIEVRPAALGISGSFNNQVQISGKKLDEIIQALRQADNIINSTTNAVSNQGTIIDRIYGNKHGGYIIKHPHVRFHNSVNKWIQQGVYKMARMKIEVSLDDLCTKSARDICIEAESLAKDTNFPPRGKQV